jgi:hypothetical protein
MLDLVLRGSRGAAIDYVLDILDMAHIDHPDVTSCLKLADRMDEDDMARQAVMALVPKVNSLFESMIVDTKNNYGRAEVIRYAFHAFVSAVGNGPEFRNVFAYHDKVVKLVGPTMAPTKVSDVYAIKD